MDAGFWIDKGVNTFKRNLPIILTVTACAGVVTTAILTGKAVLKADQLVKEKEEEIDDCLTNTEKAKLVWKEFVAPVASGVATGACIIGANRSAAHQLATVITAAKTIEKQWMDNRDAANDIFGDRGLRKIDERVNEKRAGQFLSNEKTIYETGHGTCLCCEGFLTGALFRADREWVRKCVNDFNLMLIDGEHLSYNDFIRMLIPTIDGNVLPRAGDIFEYNLDVSKRTLEIVEDSFLSSDTSTPVYIFNVRKMPLILDYPYEARY